MLRAKGVVWLSGEDVEESHWQRGMASLAGCSFSVTFGEPWFASGTGTGNNNNNNNNHSRGGGRRTELVVIGQDMDHAAMTAALEACVLTDDEMAAYEETWLEAFPPWATGAAPGMIAVLGKAKARLTQERKSWRRSHPPGFTAKPKTTDGGQTDLLNWTCLVPGKESTDWAGGTYEVTMDFTEDYPSKPPVCKFAKPLFHPNIDPSCDVSSAVWIGEDDWRPELNIEQILLGLQDFLTRPQIDRAVAHTEAHQLYMSDRSAYGKRVRQEVAEEYSI